VKSLSPYSRRLDAIELDPDDADQAVDPAKHAWYHDGCPCGVPAGTCKQHPRARESQRPPEGDWLTWGYIAGRGSGKTRAGAEWIQDRVDSGKMRVGALIAPNLDDVRTIMIQGPSGLAAVAAPWNRPRFESSKHQVTWPNGAIAHCLSGEIEDGPRGMNLDTIWADELACWERPEGVWSNAMLALRVDVPGGRPQAMITTTPRRVEMLKAILAQPSTVKTKDTTYANEAHLPASFFDAVTALYAGTRLGEQELNAEFVETSDGAWFKCFNSARHVCDVDAEYHPAFPVNIAIDAGTSRFTGAVYFQVRPSKFDGLHRITVFAEYLEVDKVSQINAKAIKELAGLRCHGRIDLVRLDPAAGARSSLGPAAFGEYERVFGSRITARWPQHQIIDGLDTIELLLEHGELVIHSRCTKLKEAFGNYVRKRRGSEWIDVPADGHPEEDMMDALRGGIRDAMPEGRTIVGAGLRRTHAGKI
jgi:hypothetical protein